MGFAEVVELRCLTGAQRTQLVDGDPDPFRVEDLALRWRTKDRYIALKGLDGRLIAVAGLLAAEAQVEAGGLLSVVGIGGVIVAEPHRSQGLGTHIVDEALRMAATMGPGVAMLFCRPNLARFYERHGFSEMTGEVFVQQPDAVVQMPLLGMWRTLRYGLELPTGRVLVRSLPF